MTSADTRRFARFCVGSLVGGIAVAGLMAPVASAAPDCSDASVEATKASVTTQAQSYMDSHPSGNQMLMTAALQPRPQAAATIAAYAKTNPQEYADFKSILAPLGNLQRQCGVSVVPAQFQWAFDQFVG
ncbi:hemophore-related protein [Mycolicibacterium sp.]|uniref:hemophore-related protein n=1 Tax=Mycolicibacterium sp. TaxID=2320850 RepID=UPI0025D053BB|nr:hemophore-related protein [Mycolicibacterium sp.]